MDTMSVFLGKHRDHRTIVFIVMEPSSRAQAVDTAR
jgi:hypothetical protein